MNSPERIVFYDGVCGMCSKGVRWMLKHDKKGELRFAPIQGETYARLEHSAKPTDMSTMVFLEKGKLHTRSDAVAYILMAMGGWPAMLGIKLWAVPRPLRDWGYRLVAANRYRVAGKTDGACPVPTPDQRGRFLP